jgi:soluble lytic murein transglycosylase-like protein
MDCESGGDPNAYNEASGASGLFQFLPGTWASASVSAGWAGADVFDGEANIAVAAWLSGSSTGPWSHWNCKP